MSNDEDYATELSVIQDPTLLSTNLTESIEVQTICVLRVQRVKMKVLRASVDALTAFDGEERFMVSLCFHTKRGRMS